MFIASVVFEGYEEGNMEDKQSTLNNDIYINLVDSDGTTHVPTNSSEYRLACFVGNLRYSEIGDGLESTQGLWDGNGAFYKLSCYTSAEFQLRYWDGTSTHLLSVYDESFVYEETTNQIFRKYQTNFTSTWKHYYTKSSSSWPKFVIAQFNPCAACNVAQINTNTFFDLPDDDRLDPICKPGQNNDKYYLGPSEQGNQNNNDCYILHTTPNKPRLCQLATTEEADGSYGGTDSYDTCYEAPVNTPPSPPPSPPPPSPPPPSPPPSPPPPSPPPVGHHVFPPDKTTDFGLLLNVTINLNAALMTNVVAGDEILSVDTQGKDYNMLATYYNNTWHPEETATLLPGVGYLFIAKSGSTRTLEYQGTQFTGSYDLSLEESAIVSFSPMISNDNATIVFGDLPITTHVDGIETYVTDNIFKRGKAYRILTTDPLENVDVSP